MQKWFVLFVVIVQVQICNGQESNLKLDIHNVTSKVDALVNQYQKLDIFSGAVLIAENGIPFYNKAIGLANREKRISNTTSTRFDIGSINKLFTKALILQLIEEGKIKPNDTLGMYLKGFPKEPSEKVTVQQLIGHTSGYGDYMQKPGFFDRPKSQQTIGAIIEMIKHMPLMFEPGKEWQYSNAGYILLGGIIEQVTGKSYYQNVKERIVQPLGMINTVVDEQKSALPNRAIGYIKTMRGELENNEGVLLIPTPAGGFVTTTSDLLKFMEAYFYSNKLIKNDTRKYDDFYPFVEKVKKEGGAIPVAGGFEGANAVAYIDLQKHLIVIVLANMDEPVAEQLAGGIYKIINGKEPDKPALPAIQNVYKAFHEHGVSYVKQHFEELSANFPDSDARDNLLNNVGYNLLFSGETDQALQVFKLNTELFPDIANCWDSYGEALLKKGDKKNALIAYQKALSIRPDLPSALEAIKKLNK